MVPPPLKKISFLDWITIGLSFSVIGVIIYILYRNWPDLIRFPWHLNPTAIFLVLIFHSIAVAFTFLGWHLMMIRLGDFNNIKLSIRYYYTSNLAKRLPTSLPFIGSRLVTYQNEGIPVAAVMNCVLLEQLLLAMGGIIAFLIILPLNPKFNHTLTLFLAIGGLCLLAIFLLQPHILIKMTNRILRHFKRPELIANVSRRDILVWVGIYTLPWFFAGISFYFVPLALSNYIKLPLINAMQIAILSTLASLLYFIVPGGIALKEVTASVLLTAWMPLSTAIVITIASRILQTCNDIFWALISLTIPQPPKENDG